ncbi:MAG: MFS transporter, partial [Lentisphaeria bacterium]|nr:MFS transporter [Lentisphaeria bacterium]
QLAWLLYDPANAAYTMIVRTVAAPIYLAACAKGIWSDSQVTSFWSLTASAAGLAAGAFAVIAGPKVDARKRKVPMVLSFTLLGVVSVLSYLFVPQGFPLVVLAISFAGIASFMASNSFYDSLLIDISTPDERNKLSTAGYALGYAGALVSFLLCLPLMKLAGGAYFFKGAFVIAALWWLFGAMPLFFKVKEVPAADTVKAVKFTETCRYIFTQKNILLFLIAYFLYIDGVGTILLAATPLASGLKISGTMIMLTILALQIIGLPFTLIYGKLAEKFSAKRMIYSSIAVYFSSSVIVTVMSFCTSLLIRQILFYTAAVLIGTSQGGIQSLSRSLFSRIIPAERAAELFAVYNIFGKFTTILGPVLVYLASYCWGRSEYRVVMLIGPFMLGGWLLSKVDFPEQKN